MIRRCTGWPPPTQWLTGARVTPRVPSFLPAPRRGFRGADREPPDPLAGTGRGPGHGRRLGRGRRWRHLAQGPEEGVTRHPQGGIALDVQPVAAVSDPVLIHAARCVVSSGGSWRP